MPPARSTVRPFLKALALGAVALVAVPAGAGAPAGPPPIASRPDASPARDAARRRAELDARVRDELRSLSARAVLLPEGADRTPLLAEMTAVLRRHRVARLEIDLAAARARGDRGGAERIERILERFTRPRAEAPGAAAPRDLRREVARP